MKTRTLLTCTVMIWTVLTLVLFGAAQLEARILLPESRVLAGPLNTLASEVGEEFENFPRVLFPFLPAAGVPLAGWVTVHFEEPEGDLVDFTIDYKARPSDGAAVFGRGQAYLLQRGEVQPLPPGVNGGTLNLETEQVTDFKLTAEIRFTGLSAFGRVNRFPPRLVHSYGREDFGVDLGELPPDFFRNDIAFGTDSEGRIHRFDFSGRTVFPIGAWAAENDTLGNFPPFSLREGDMAFFPNPDLCFDPNLPPSLCPDDAVNPDALEFPEDAFFHSHLLLQSNQLREVPAERLVAPCAPAGRTDGVVEAAGGKLYHISGLAEGGELSGRVDVYDPRTNSWSEGPAILTPVYNAQSAVVGQRIYVLGGRSSGEGPAISEVQVLDTATETWSNVTELPVPTVRGGAEVYAGLVYVFFGMTNSDDGELAFSENIQVYDPATDVWLPVEVPLQLEGFATAISGTNVYLINGRTIVEGEETLSPFVTMYSTIFNGITFASPTRVPIYGGTAEVIGGRLFLAGGTQEVGGEPSSLVQMLEIGRNLAVFDLFANSFWSPIRDIPFATEASGSAVLRGEMYVIGGKATGIESPLHTVEQLDPSRGWQTCASQPLFDGGGVLNAGSLTVGGSSIAPGSLMVVSGYHLSDETLDARDQEILPTSLGGVRVEVDGQAATILSVHPNRIDFQAPYNLSDSSMTTVVLENEGSPQQAPPVVVEVAPVNPGIFVQSCGEIADQTYLFTASALACNEDGTLNTFRNAAQAGERLTLQMSGLGAVDTALERGQRAPAGVASLVQPTILVLDQDGEPIEATVESVFLAEGEVGIYDVTVILPDSIQQSSRVRISAILDGVSSNVATIAVGTAEDSTPLPCLRDTDLEFRACFPEFLPVE